jgi:hypothetical protein
VEEKGERMVRYRRSSLIDLSRSTGSRSYTDLQEDIRARFSMDMKRKVEKLEDVNVIDPFNKGSW